jgi:hypothetical protein
MDEDQGSFFKGDRLPKVIEQIENLAKTAEVLGSLSLENRNASCG